MASSNEGTVQHPHSSASDNDRVVNAADVVDAADIHGTTTSSEAEPQAKYDRKRSSFGTLISLTCLMFDMKFIALL